MKILWLTHMLPHPPVGRGVLQRTHHLLKQACRRHEVHLAAIRRQSMQSSPAEIREAERELSKFCASVYSCSLPSDDSQIRWGMVVLQSVFTPRSYTENWLASDDLFAHLEDLQESGSFDMIFVDTVGLAQYTEAFPSTPFIQQHHNIESDMIRRRAEYTGNPLKKLYFRKEAWSLKRHERDVARTAAANVVVSELDSRRLREVTGSDSIHVVENGVDVEYFKPSTPPGDGDGSLVFAGGMDWYPNRDAVTYFIQEIWPALLDDDDTRQATLIGRSPPEELRRAAAGDSRLQVPGFVDDVRPYIDRASIYVCPIRDGGGTRLKILDALAMGKPLVATEFSVEGLNLEDGRHYLRAETPEEYVEQVRRLEGDEGLREHLAVQGRNLVVERYSWEQIAKSLEAAFEVARPTAAGTPQSGGSRGD